MKKAIIALFLLSLLFIDYATAKRPYRTHRQRYHEKHAFPYHRKYRKRLYYHPYKYWPLAFTIGTMSALMDKDRRNETVVVIERELTDKELDLQNKIQKLEKELKAHKKQLRILREKKAELPKSLERKIKEMEKLSNELMESLAE